VLLFQIPSVKAWVWDSRGCAEQPAAEALCVHHLASHFASSSAAVQAEPAGSVAQSLSHSDNCWLCCVHHRYGNLVLAVEVISSTATIGYAILLIKQSTPKPSLGLPLADPNEELDPDHLLFNLRVLIPCYKEKASTNWAVWHVVMDAATRWLPDGGGVSI